MRDCPKFGCATLIADEPGNAYCRVCVAAQLAELRVEREAFDAFHAYADRVARST